MEPRRHVVSGVRCDGIGSMTTASLGRLALLRVTIWETAVMLYYGIVSRVSREATPAGHSYDVRRYLAFPRRADQEQVSEQSVFSSLTASSRPVWRILGRSAPPD